VVDNATTKTLGACRAVLCQNANTLAVATCQKALAATLRATTQGVAGVRGASWTALERLPSVVDLERHTYESLRKLQGPTTVGMVAQQASPQNTENVWNAVRQACQDPTLKSTVKEPYTEGNRVMSQAFITGDEIWPAAARPVSIYRLPSILRV
jgi:hypothetical protein